MTCYTDVSISGNTYMSYSNLIFYQNLNDAQKKLWQKKIAKGEAKTLSPGIYTTDLKTPSIDQIKKHLPEVIKDLNWEGRLAWKSALPNIDGAMVLSSGEKRQKIKIGGLDLEQRKINQRTQKCELELLSWGRMQRPTLWAAILENFSVNAYEIKLIDKKKAQSCALSFLEKAACEAFFWKDIKDNSKILEELPLFSIEKAKSEALNKIQSASLISNRLEESKIAEKLVFNWVEMAIRQNFQPYDYQIIQNLKKAVSDFKLSKNLFSSKSSPGLQESTPVERFFEAYFTNFIEGTRIPLNEAYQLMDDPRIHPIAHKDEHDVGAMIEMLENRKEWNLAFTKSKNHEEWVDALCRAHKLLFTHREVEVKAGCLKDVPNQAGMTEFVAPHLVKGTLYQLFEILKSMKPSFEKAMIAHLGFVMAHPFRDGNGRLSRMLMNAYLEEANLPRVTVFQYWRENYIDALKAWSIHGKWDSFNALMSKMIDVRNSLDWNQNLKEMGDYLTKIGAFASPNDRRWGLEGEFDSKIADEGVLKILFSNELNANPTLKPKI